MSTNVYLKSEVRELPGFKTERYSDNSGEKVQLDGISLSSDKGRVYFIISDIDSSIPDTLKQLIDEITHYEWLPRMATRETGIYRYESAECDLVEKDPGGKRNNLMYFLKMKSKKQEDIRELLHRIKVGTIRPEESYEGPQGGKSRVELERELAVAKALAENRAQQDRDLQKAFYEVSDKLKLSEETFRAHQQNFRNACEKNVRVRQFSDDFQREHPVGNWLFKVNRRIAVILDDTK